MIYKSKISVKKKLCMSIGLWLYVETLILLLIEFFPIIHHEKKYFKIPETMSFLTNF